TGETRFSPMYQIHNATVTINVNEFPPALNGAGGLIRMHYGTYMKVRERWIELVWAALTPKLQEIFTTHHFIECDLYFTRRSLHRDGMDWDNCCASLKIPADALVHLGVLKDDNPSVIKRF